MVIVTGGDDQAVCVAKVELCDHSHDDDDDDDEGSPRGEDHKTTTSGSTQKTSVGKRCGNFSPSWHA